MFRHTFPRKKKTGVRFVMQSVSEKSLTWKIIQLDFATYIYKASFLYKFTIQSNMQHNE